MSTLKRPNLFIQILSQKPCRRYFWSQKQSQLKQFINDLNETDTFDGNLRLIQKFGPLRAIGFVRRAPNSDMSPLVSSACQKIIYTLADSDLGAPADLANIYLVHIYLSSPSLKESTFIKNIEYIKNSKTLKDGQDLQSLAILAIWDQKHERWSKARQQYERVMKKINDKAYWTGLSLRYKQPLVVPPSEIGLRYATFKRMMDIDEPETAEIEASMKRKALKAGNFEAYIDQFHSFQQNPDPESRRTIEYHDCLVKLAVSGFHEATYHLGNLYCASEAMTLYDRELQDLIKSPQTVTDTPDFIPAAYSVTKDIIIRKNYHHKIETRILKALDWYKLGAFAGYTPSAFAGLSLAKKYHHSDAVLLMRLIFREINSQPGRSSRWTNQIQGAKLHRDVLDFATARSWSSMDWFGEANKFIALEWISPWSFLSMNRRYSARKETFPKYDPLSLVPSLIMGSMWAEGREVSYMRPASVYTDFCFIKK